MELFKHIQNRETTTTQEVKTIIDNSTLDFMVKIENISKSLANDINDKMIAFIPGGENGGLYTEIKNAIAQALNGNRMSSAFNGLNPATRQIFNITLDDFRQEFGEPFKSVVVNASTDITTTENSFRQMPSISNLSDYFTGVIRTTLNKKTDLDSAKGYISTYVPNMFNNFFGQRVVSNYESFTREINKRFSNSFNLVWALYAGPEDGKNREFCSDRVNEYFHKTEIDSWPETEGDWEGRMAGTNSVNINQRLGGYNCRHKLQWVKASQVPQATKAAFELDRQTFIPI